LLFKHKYMACDRIHYKGHKKAPEGQPKTYCEKYCDPDKNVHFEKKPTERCEETFQWLSRYKSACKHQSMTRRRSFVCFVCEDHNLENDHKLNTLKATLAKTKEGSKQGKEPGYGDQELVDVLGKELGDDGSASGCSDVEDNAAAGDEASLQPCVPTFTGFVVVPAAPAVEGGALVGREIAVRWPDDEGKWLQAKVMLYRQRSGRMLTQNYQVKYTMDHTTYRHVLTAATYNYTADAPLDAWVLLEKASSSTSSC
jgi:hypothetical protein